MEAEPSKPVFEDAPKRLRFFVLETFRQQYHSQDALSVVGRVFCKPELIISIPEHPWLAIQRCIDNCNWWEVYNLIEAIYADRKAHYHDAILFKGNVNSVFARKALDGGSMTMGTSNDSYLRLST
jgi:hypothetical protein